jgi:tungstate transport system substrate-binding protein
MMERWGSMNRGGRATGGAVFILAALLVVLSTVVLGCGSNTTTTQAVTTTAAPTTITAASTTTTAAPVTTTTAKATTTTTIVRNPGDIILASTTSTKDSGLFDVLIPAFEKANPTWKVKVVAVGSGAAIKLGEQKDADVLLVHSPADEKAFMDKGLGIERRDVMYNDFIVVGAKEDPAGIKGMKVAADAFKKIADAKATFITRGDNSGTNAKELTIWKAAGITPSGSWYQNIGQGMGEALRISNEKKAYTLSDRATYLSMKDALQLDILVEGDTALFNQYGVITVKDAKEQAGAKALLEWITSDDGQNVIKTYGVEKYGQVLFVPNYKK